MSFSLSRLLAPFRRLKYFLAAFVAGELPRISILTIIPYFEESMFSKDEFNKVVVLTWVSDKLSKSHIREVKDFISRNPDYKFCFLNNDMQNDWMKEKFSSHKIYHVYKNTIFGASKNDIFRYCFVREYGCAFFAINVFANRPLTEILKFESDPKLALSAAVLDYDSHLVKGSLLEKYNGQSFVMAAVVAPKYHPVLNIAIEMICDRYEIVKDMEYSKVDKAIWWFTGPFLFADSVIEYVTLNDKKTFEELRIQFLPPLFGNSLYRPEVVKFRYISQASYIGFKHCAIAYS